MSATYTVTPIPYVTIHKEKSRDRKSIRLNTHTWLVLDRMGVWYHADLLLACTLERLWNENRLYRQMPQDRERRESCGP